MDEDHPGNDMADAMSECIKQFIWTRLKNREARGVLELQRILPGQDLRRLEGQRGEGHHKWKGRKEKGRMEGERGAMRLKRAMRSEQERDR